MREQIEQYYLQFLRELLGLTPVNEDKWNDPKTVFSTALGSDASYYVEAAFKGGFELGQIAQRYRSNDEKED